MSIEIKQLNQYPAYAPILAHWSYMEWYRKRSIEFDLVLKAYQKRAENNTIPFTYVAISDNIPVGMVTLKNNDLKSREDLNPWLASLYVYPEYRNRGIANLLITSLIDKAKNIGFDKVFLFLAQTKIDDLEKYYMKRGWEFLDNAVDNDGNETQIFFYKIK